jgi:hypothetical protein
VVDGTARPEPVVLTLGTSYVPPWLDEESGNETRDQKAERRNRYVAEALWRARAVLPDVIDSGT